MCNPIKNTDDQGGRFIFIASSGIDMDKKIRQTYLSVESNVVDAKIYIDGPYIGDTPLKFLTSVPNSIRGWNFPRGNIIWRYQPKTMSLVKSGSPLPPERTRKWKFV
jgi:hypothetical protein